MRFVIIYNTETENYYKTILLSFTIFIVHSQRTIF